MWVIGAFCLLMAATNLFNRSFDRFEKAMFGGMWLFWAFVFLVLPRLL